jgi:hypothetical protein
MDRRKVLSVDGKIKAKRESENGDGGKKAGVCREFGLVNYTIQAIWKKLNQNI